MRHAILIALALSAVAGPSSADESSRLVFAAPTRAGEEWSARRLFNAALRSEERGNLLAACQLFMASRLAPRSSFADVLYARGAALRLVRLLAGRDDDAALAAAMLIEDKGETSDLGPLIRTLMRRLESERSEVELMTGTLLSLRYNPRTERVTIEVEVDGGDRKIIEADGAVAPFSAGNRVTALVRRVSGRASAGLHLIGLSKEGHDGWTMLRIHGLPGDPFEKEGSLIGRR
ncbi:MAG: hypothetical protein U1E65_23500 [Myxococcota bacterium]